MTERSERALNNEFTRNTEQARTPHIDLEELEHVKADIMKERKKQGRHADTLPIDS